MVLSSMECPRIDMASLGQILSRTFFWSYERGTWQYDLAVILILVFVLATPRGWFHDKPESGGAPAAGQRLPFFRDGKQQTNRLAARNPAPPPKTSPQNGLHTALNHAFPQRA